MPERHRGKLIGLGALLVIVIGFVLVKPATPIISVAAEPIIEGGYEITNTMISAWVIMVVLAIVVFWLYRRLRKVEEALVPRGLQNVVEALLDALFNVVKLVAGEKNGRHFFPVVASIFLILLVANWFGLFPWNNSFGRTVDLRFEYIEALEKDVEDVVAAPEGTGLSAAQVNRTFSTFYFDPIPFEASALDEADVLIAAALRDEVSGSERAVREFFREDPVPAGMEGAALIEATEERLEEALATFGVSPALLERYGAATEAVALERALVFNLPLSLAAVGESELHGAVINSGGVNVVPIKADDFEYDPFLEDTIAGADGSFGGRARIFDPLAEGEENVPPGSGEVALPVTLNTAHVGIILKQVREDVIGIEAGEIARSKGVGEIFPLFRSIATDLNLPLAVALWAFIFVQLWGVQALGVGTNFGRFLGVGRAAVVTGPIGVFVGILEIISEVARIISFTFRLFGNIFAGEIVLFMAAFLVPFLVATVFYGLEVFVGFIQAFVFAMLTLVFAVTAVSHGEHGGEDEETEEGVAGR